MKLSPEWPRPEMKMKEKKRTANVRGLRKMLMPTIIMGMIAVIMLYIGYQKGGREHIEGLKITGDLLMEITPLLIFSFIIAGMIQVLIPQELISKWVGAESGFRGILIGTIFGSLTPSGPFVSMPIAAGFLRAGASIGTVVAFMTAWSLLGVSRLPIEFGIMGWQFTLIRIASGVFIFPVVAGLLADMIFKQ
jgi:uncharacterized membrane protein YraQ (UPF0718 family)